MAAIGRPLGIPLIVDNTAAPLLARPFDHGAAVVVYSSTKYLGGHGTSIGGLIVDGGNFPWGDFPSASRRSTRPIRRYHGAVWSEAVKPLGPIAYIIKARVTLLRDIGAALSPFNAFLTLQGIETLALRIERHSKNAVAVANGSPERPEVTKVIHPSLQSGTAPSARRNICQRRPGRAGRLRARRRARGGTAVHRRAASYSTTSPTSATRARWRSIRRRRRTRSFPPRTARHRRDRRLCAACRSASSTSTTSSAISTMP